MLVKSFRNTELRKQSLGIEQIQHANTARSCKGLTPAPPARTQEQKQGLPESLTVRAWLARWERVKRRIVGRIQ
jgi:hypothetical protein